MPMLPLPGPSAVLTYRSNMIHSDISLSKDHSNLPSVSHEIVSNFNVIAKGQGYMAVNVTLDKVDYTGMLFSHNRNGLPGLFADCERKKFMDLCNNNVSPDELGIDQWMSSMADRQCMPGRPRRNAQPNFAKRNGRMICHSCLCLVPEDRSMPFACNCKERQRQRAARAHCGGHQPMRDRLVVVAHANSNNNNTNKTTLQPVEGKALVKQKTSDFTVETSERAATMTNGARSLTHLKRKSLGTMFDASMATVKAAKLTVKSQSQTASTSSSVNAVDAESTIANNLPAKIVSEYVVRKNNNSPLQITLLKVPNGNADTTSITSSNGHHRHHHRRHNDEETNGAGHHHHHRHHRKDNNTKNNYIVDSTTKPSGGEESRVPRNSGCDPRLRVTQLQTSKLSNGQNDITHAKSLLLINEKEDSPIDNKSYDCVNEVNTSPKLKNLLSESTIRRSMSTKHPIRDKRMSLEAHISMIKERAKRSSLEQNQGTAEVSSTKDQNKLPNESLLKSKQEKQKTFENNDVKMSVSPLHIVKLQSVSPSPSTGYSSICLSSLANDLPESVTSTVSSLIRNEIHRHMTTNSSTMMASYPHGIARGAIVWARAPPCAYWPGLVIGVTVSTARVAWCGEHTYNEVDVATVSDFLGALATRFVPNAKENRNNRKLCNAIAEALALTQPPIAELDRRLNGHVAKLLAEKYDWDLTGLSIYRGGKLISVRSSSMATASSSTITVVDTPVKAAAVSTTAATSPLPAVTSTTTMETRS